MSRSRLLFILVLAWVLASGDTPANATLVECSNSVSDPHLSYNQTGNSAQSSDHCQANSFLTCQLPILGSVSYSVAPGCNPVATSCTVTATVAVQFPGLHQNPDATGGAFSYANLQLFTQQGAFVDQCGSSGAVIFEDFGTVTVSKTLQCAPGAGKYVLRARTCPDLGCEQPPASMPPLLLSLDFAQGAGCPPPPRKDECKRCEGCITTGGGCGVNVGGKGPTCKVAAAGAHFHYAASGAGGTGYPGTAAWTPTLGRNWSHDYAQRIVLDPNDSHVWLITPEATFREWSGLSSGVYGTVSPSDEKRTLRRTVSGWRLEELDGTVHTFDSGGRWTQTADRNGNAKIATYNGSGQLTGVAFPDGRSEAFTYQPSGKVATLTEIGVGGSPTRLWSYTWTANDLTRVDRPDGTAWEFFYSGTVPGALARWDLVGTDLSRRVEGAWTYDAQGNVIQSWRGDTSVSGPNAVDVYGYSYNSPTLPTQTLVTDPLGKVTTYDVARDTMSDVPKITKTSGDCPTCGTGPNSVFTYADATNPLLYTQVVDGRNLTTQYTYNSRGQMTSKTEAATTPKARLTTWTYGNASFPAFPTQIDLPSTSGGSALRTTTLTYNGTGDLATQTIQGAEGGSAFTNTTQSTFNAAGRPLSVDPPGYGTSDQATSTYDSSRGNLVPLTRTDPLVGTTTFGYDGLNRQVSVTDPNYVQTLTTYDGLHRVTSVTQRGAIVADDLVTTYQYNPLGDLFLTTLPRGNVVEYGYDGAGRLTSVERKPDASTHGERTFYTLDSFGHRIKEQQQHWSGSAWASDTFTDFVYSTRCHLDKTINADGTVTEYAYDCDGNLEKLWDANHPRASNPIPTQTYAYDALNRLTSLSQPWTGAGGGTALTQYDYDVQDHLTSVTDAESNQTTYTYGDRDLMTQEVSPVSGTATSTYNEHRQLVIQVDGRGMSMTRTLDAADRPTLTDFVDNTLDTTYSYGSTSAQFDVGRLIGITKNGQTVAYSYDRFGRLLQDGGLAYQYDKNGNRTRVTYPGGVSAIYTQDFADRQATLQVDSGTGAQSLVTASSYKPGGPLASLTLANGLTETRTFDSRYRPDHIQLGSLLDWDYTEDAVGNPTQISGTILGQSYSATFGYQDNLYFLTQGDGPWGTRSWTYDRIGNRLTSQESGGPAQSYTYAGSGHNPKLLQITPAPEIGSGSLQVAYDNAGNQISSIQTDNEGSAETTHLDASQENKLSALRSGTGVGRSDMLYDGRGYLRQANLTFTGSPEFVKVTPTYSSEGTLMARTEDRAWTGSQPGPDGEDSTWLASNLETTQIFYFAGRPVAQLTNGPELLYLTTDHLGTPILATTPAGQAVWGGGLEPFGRVWTAGGNPDPEPAAFRTKDGFHLKGMGRLTAENIFLRYPGQWASDAFRLGGVQGDLYYNVNRWYGPAMGKYSGPDPLSFGSVTPFAYTENMPLRMIDPAGLRSIIYTGCEVWFTDDDFYIIHTCKASSGKPGNGPGRQNVVDEGPIPEGTYWFRPSEFSGGWRSIFRGRGWGWYRTPLHPRKGTNTFGRDNFFLHGDRRGRPGSLGCIDIDDCDEWARNWAMEQPNRVITVYVDYGSKVCN